nr:PREDICTED: uncharacterized protein LOC108202847 isoform X2 [Daucus carota subsp. sativus]
MVKGGLLKDDADWSKLGVKEGQKLMMMGTADEIVKAPEKGPVFMEDLPEEEQVVAVLTTNSFSIAIKTPHSWDARNGRGFSTIPYRRGILAHCSNISNERSIKKRRE